MLRTQPHARWHLLATVVVIVLGFSFKVSRLEWALLILAISIVWIAEAINTSIEFLCDEVTLERRERIKHAKDIAAFSVLAAATGSASIGLLVFAPRIYLLCHDL